MDVFKGLSVVSCGTMRRELTHLREEGFLEVATLLFTSPGLHEWQPELRRQLTRLVTKAGEESDGVIVVYGERCHLDPQDPSMDVDGLLRRQEVKALRVRAKNCVDMLADAEERRKAAAGDKVYWLTPGWLRYWDFIFKDYDRGKANETFGSYDRATLLDPFGAFDETALESPEKILQISDFMRIPLEPYVVTLERLKGLLEDAARRLNPA